MGNATKVKSKYPELDKLSALKGQTQKLGEFLDWLEQKGLIISRYHKHSLECVGGSEADLEVNRGRLTLKPMPAGQKAKCGVSEEDIEPMYIKIETMIANYFDLDENKMEDERRAMLADLQKGN